MEDEYKVVCALSNSATFDDLEWPWTPISRSQHSLKADISQTVHPIHSMFGSRLCFRGRRIEWRYLQFDKIQDGGWRPSWILKNDTTSQPVCQSTWCLLLGSGFRRRRIEWRYYRFDKIQDGSWRPSWNDGAVAHNPCVSWAFLFILSVTWQNVWMLGIVLLQSCMSCSCLVLLTDENAFMPFIHSFHFCFVAYFYTSVVGRPCDQLSVADLTRDWSIRCVSWNVIGCL